MIIFTENQPITFEHIDAVKELADKIKRVRELCANSSIWDWALGDVVEVSAILDALDGEQE